MKRLARALIATTLVVTALGTSSLLTVHADTGGSSYTCVGVLAWADIPGNVIVPSGSTCIIVNTTINGNVIVQSGARLDMQASTVERNVLSHGARGIILREDHVVGNVELKSGAVSTRVINTAIGGQADLSGNSGTTILDNNTVGKDAHFNNNTGRNEVAFNTIAGMLQCDANTPPPLQALNAAGRYQGQCAP